MADIPHGRLLPVPEENKLSVNLLKFNYSVTTVADHVIKFNSGNPERSAGIG
jgi:hypothetical protein